MEMATTSQQKIKDAPRVSSWVKRLSDAHADLLPPTMPLVPMCVTSHAPKRLRCAPKVWPYGIYIYKYI